MYYLITINEFDHFQGQYVFLYKALNHGLQENISPVKRTDFISSYAEVSKESGDINNNIMYEEFQVIFIRIHSIIRY